MKRRLARLFPASILAIAASGCGPTGPDPLIGEWAGEASFNGTTDTLTLYADHSFGHTFAGNGGPAMCTGSIHYGNQSWSSSPTTITFNGVPICSGNASCTGCGTYATSCTYSFSNNMNALRLNGSACSIVTNSYTRQ